MTLQILVPLHAYPVGNSDTIAAHASAVARHPGGPKGMGCDFGMGGATTGVLRDLKPPVLLSH